MRPTSKEELLEAANKLFLGLLLTRKILARIEAWRKSIAPDLPFHFEGLFETEKVVPTLLINGQPRMSSIGQPFILSQKQIKAIILVEDKAA